MKAVTKLPASISNLATGEAKGGHAEGDVFTSIESIKGSNFSDVLVGDDNQNILNGEEGDDYIYGGDGDDQLFGEDGDDILQGYSGAEHLDGGAGTDTLYYAHSFNTEGVGVDLQAGKGFAGAEGDTYANLENIVGTSNGNDILYGDDNANAINAVGGADVIDARGGNDIIYSKLGIDHITGGAGSDRYVFESYAKQTFLDVDTPDDPTDTTRTLQIQDQVAIIYDFDINDPEEIIDLSDQLLDEVVLRDHPDGTLIELDGGRNLILVGIDKSALSTARFVLPEGITGLTLGDPATTAGLDITGSALDNILHGGFGDDTLSGGAGNDNIYGSFGDNVLEGGADQDWLVAGQGTDILDGGEDDDVASFLLSGEGVYVDVSNNDLRGGTAEGDTLIDIEKVEGSSFNDTIVLGGSVTQADGQGGDDTLVATIGTTSQILSGGSGSDTFVIKDGAAGYVGIMDFDFDDPDEKN